MSAAAVAAALRERHSFVLTSHARPDGDALGSQMALAFALRALGKQVRLIDRDPMPAPYRHLPGVDGIENAEAVSGPGGLAVLAFREGTPYQGEDLIYDPAGPGFLVRCSRSAGPTPGICLHEQRIDAADVVVRFPRDWLDDWHTVAGTIERLVARLRPSHG